MCVDLTRMNEVTDYHPEDFTVVVQPGVTRLALNDYVKGDGLWFPIGIPSLFLLFHLSIVHKL